MGSFSIWHWLVVLVVIAVFGGGVWLVVRPKKRTEEKPIDLGGRGFRDPTRLYWWTRFFVYGFLSASALRVLVLALQFPTYLSLFNLPDAAVRNIMARMDADPSLLEGIADLILSTFMIISGILILVWIYRMNYNVRQLGAQGLMAKPGWSVGWYFIPFANLVKPWTSMEQLWQASHNPLAWPDEPVPSFLAGWWICWIAWNIIGNVSMRVSSDIGSAGHALWSLIFDAAWCALGVAVSFLLLRVMRGIQTSLISHHISPA